MSCGDIFLGFLAILFPPLPVWIKCGLCSADSLINVCLLLLGYLPGLLHAWYIIAKYPDPEYELVASDDGEGGPGGRVTYYYVSRDQQPANQGTGQPDGGRAHRELQRGGSNYGTLNAGVAGSSEQPAPAPAQQPATPPTYAEAVKGDHKVQSDE